MVIIPLPLTPEGEKLESSHMLPGLEINILEYISEAYANAKPHFAAPKKSKIWQVLETCQVSNLLIVKYNNFIYYLNLRKVENNMDGIITKHAISTCCAGVIGFGLIGSIYAILGFRFEPLPPFGGFTGPIIGFVINGIIGALILGSALKSIKSIFSSAIGFGLGYIIPAVVIPVAVLASGYEDGYVSIATSITGFGLSFGIAGLIGTPFLIPKHICRYINSSLLGGLLFGIAGILGGLLHHFIPVSFSLPILQSPLASFLIEIAFIGFVGGGLLGFTAGYLEEKNNQEKILEVSTKKQFIYISLFLVLIIITPLMIFLPGEHRFYQVRNSPIDNSNLSTEEWNGMSIPKSSSLHEAAMYGDTKSAAYLIAQGVDVNLKRSDGWTPLHLAAMNGEKDVTEFLISKGADINAKADNGDTPLHLAISHKPIKTEVVKLLVESGANPYIINANGESSLDMAERLGVEEVFQNLDLSRYKTSSNKVNETKEILIYEEIRNKDLSDSVKKLSPEERRIFFEGMKNKPVSLLLRISEIKESPQSDGTYIIRSMISNGVGVRIFSVSGETAEELRKGQLLRVKGKINEMFYSTGVQIHIKENAILEPLEK